LPARAQVGPLPGAREGKTAPLQWRVEWATIGQGKLVARLHAELLRGETPAAETPGLQKELRALLEALAVSTTWSVGP